MAKIIRYDGDVKPFGVNATGTERTVFGSPSAAPVQSDTLDANINADYLLGWEKIAPGAKPPKQYFNGALFTATQLNAYLHQIGIAEWNGGQQYQIDSFTNRNGVLYQCKTVDHTSITPPESDVVNWELAIKLASETVAGIAEIATQAETDAGVDDSTIVTPKKLRWGFLMSMSANGYIVLPTWLGGFIIQWGTSGAVASGGSLIVTLPIAFPTSASICYGMPSTGVQAGAWTASAQILSNSQITVYQFSHSASASGVKWLAFGN